MRRIQSIGVSIEPPLGVQLIHIYGTLHYEEDGTDKEFKKSAEIIYLDEQSWTMAAAEAAGVLKLMIDFAKEITLN